MRREKWNNNGNWKLEIGNWKSRHEFDVSDSNVRNGLQSTTKASCNSSLSLVVLHLFSRLVTFTIWLSHTPPFIFSLYFSYTIFLIRQLLYIGLYVYLVTRDLLPSASRSRGHVNHLSLSTFSLLHSPFFPLQFWSFPSF